MATRGGPGRGQGRPKGARNKNPARPRVQKQITFYVDEWEVIEPEIGGNFNQWARKKCLKKDENK